MGGRGSASAGRANYNVLEANAKSLASSETLSHLTTAERASITEYTGGEYRLINNVASGESEGDSDTREHISNIDSALAKSVLAKSVVLYRGYDLASVNKAIDENTLKGSVIQSSRFVSTTRLDDEATYHSALGRLAPVARIVLPKGFRGAAAVEGISKHPHEQEYLLARNLKFKVTAVELKTNSKGRKVQEFTMVPV